MRRPFTTQEAYEKGITQSMLRWAVGRGEVHRLSKGVYLRGKEQPTKLERALGVLISTDGIASGTLVATLHELDGVTLNPPYVTVPPERRIARPEVRRCMMPIIAETEVNGFSCIDGLQTILELAAVLDDLRWEQALESVLRKELTTIYDIESRLTSMGELRMRGVRRIRRVLSWRSVEIPPTESLLETLMVQLIREKAVLPEAKRQVNIYDEDRFVARVDLAWPEYGVFLELDGEHHKGQPVYDARRETAVVATTGWLPGRFTWTEVVKFPNSTHRRLVQLFKTAKSKL